MRRPRKLLVPGILAGVVAGGYLWLWGGGSGADVLVPRPVPGAASRAGVPSPEERLFDFDNAYLDGRSAWFLDRFREHRRALEKAPLPEECVVECEVHRSPFTKGPWVQNLDEELSRHREETEAQAVEATTTFFVRNARPRDLLLYLTGSEFSERVPEEGTLEQTTLFPPFGGVPEGLQSLPDLEPHHFVTRQKWKRPLAQPTDVTYVNAMFQDGDCLAWVYEAWRNGGGPDHAVVRLASGQYTVMPRDGGSLVRITSYYSGQSIPPLMDLLVVNMTATFYRKVAALIGEEITTWTASPEHEERFRKLGL
jgi:hypothetical protein